MVTPEKKKKKDSIEYSFMWYSNNPPDSDLRVT